MKRIESDNEFRITPAVRPRKQVEEQLREAILSGQFESGDRLPPENVLAEQFAVSRPTVREALQSLVAAGLIRKIPGATGGSFVNSVSPEALSNVLRESMSNVLRLGALDIIEVTDVRRLLEVPAARLAAANRTDENISAMSEVVEYQRNTTLADPKIPHLDASFHGAVAEASGNRLLGAFVTALHLISRPASHLELSKEVGHATVLQHIAILAAIKAHDEEAAGEAMKKHLDYVEKFSTNPKYQNPA